ncbi:peroxiredoxin-like family protein [Sphaerothrix gracilis]|uniref:peroxiredoxin-like family protein n=1 Tax=Sphaerothrix gracilis TaxID=3151835 RepID=UPI0031FCC30D
MTTSTKLMPGTPAPELTVKTVAGKPWNLANQSPENFTMVVFYRGLHCPICKTYLEELEQKLDRFAQIGVEPIAISGDSAERAKETHSDWDVNALTVGYDFSIDDMRRWGLYISAGAADKEPDLFGEPALYLIRPTGELYYVGLNNAPFARPTFDDLLDGLDFILQNDYPTRGAA